MLTANYVTAERGITVPYESNFEGKKKNSGFVDIRGRPDLAAQIPEASISDSLKSLLVSFAESSSRIFTIGCDLGSGQRESVERGHVAGGYVQIVMTEFKEAVSYDYLAIAHAVSDHMEGKSEGHYWELEHVYTPVDFKLDLHSGIVSSLQVWFHASAITSYAAGESREFLIGQLQEGLIAATG
jgi:hypothetical protein